MVAILSRGGGGGWWVHPYIEVIVAFIFILHYEQCITADALVSSLAMICFDYD